MNFSQHKRIAIVGAGVSGQAAKRLLLLKGFSNVPIFDAVSTKGDYSDPQKFIQHFNPEVLVVSPGVPLATGWIQNFIAAGGTVESELNLAAAELSSEKLVGVTGSLGKSTTVSLLAAGARSFDPHAFAGGNLGTPLATYIADILENKRPRAEWVILELSSFQLENAHKLKFMASAVTYLSSNHLERYPSLNAYYETKWNLVKQTSDLVVLNENGGDLKTFASSHPARAKLVWSSRGKSPISQERLASAKLVGAHNKDNIVLAATLAHELAWPESYASGMLSFGGLPHRVEDVGRFGEIRFLDDSKATALESVMTAVESVLSETPQGTLWLLLGGRDKKHPWEKLNYFLKLPRLKIAFFGEGGELAQKQSALPGEFSPHLKQALTQIKSVAKSGDTVLLSPGGTSLDEFKNFEDRGRAFRNWAKEIFGS